MHKVLLKTAKCGKALELEEPDLVEEMKQRHADY